MRIFAPLVLLLLPASAVMAAPALQAGAARVDITPPGPIWMSGYASRTKPSEGVMMPIFAKALAIQDSKGQRVVLVSTDLIGMPRTLTDWVSGEVMKRYKLDRAHIVFNFLPHPHRPDRARRTWRRCTTSTPPTPRQPTTTASCSSRSWLRSWAGASAICSLP